MWPNEMVSFKAAALRWGYHCYYNFGISNSKIPRGGLCTLVERGLTSRLGCNVNFGPFGWRIFSSLIFMLRPRLDLPGKVMLRLNSVSFSCFFPRCRSRFRLPWLAVGDANEVPGDSLIGDCLQTCGGVICAQGCSTRWESSREIDWFATNLRDALSQPCCSDLYLSDHKLILADFLVPARDRTVGVLPSTPDWTKPAGLSTTDWRASLEQSCELHRPDDSIFLLPVQDAWDIFNCAVDDMFRTALTTLAHRSTDPEQATQVGETCGSEDAQRGFGKMDCQAHSQERSLRNGRLFSSPKAS